MKYNLYIASPEEVATSIGRCVERECTLPLEDVLASPNFDWYAGLCVVAIDSEDNDIIYAGIYNEKECVKSDLIITWKDEKDGRELLRNVEILMSEASLIKVVIDLCEMISVRMTELDIDHEEFDEGIDFIKRFSPKTTKRDVGFELVRIDTARMSLRASQLSRLSYFQSDALTTIRICVLALFHQTTLYEFAVSFCRTMNDANNTSTRKESEKLAEYLRKTVSFREIALRAVQ